MINRVNRARSRLNWWRKDFFGSVDRCELEKGVLQVQGWGLAKGATIVKAEVFLGEQLLGQVSYGEIRPDIAALFPQSSTLALNCGFSGMLFSGLQESGIHSVIIRFTDNKQRHFSLTNQLELKERIGLSGQLEQPAPLSRASGVVEVSGWAVAYTTDLEVLVSLNGVFLGHAYYGLPRPELVLPAVQSQTNIGYRGTFSIKGFQAGNHELEVRLLHNSVPLVVYHRQIEIVPPLLKGSLDLPLYRERVSGTARIQGWAISEVALLEQVDVLLNGEWLGTAALGIFRPDVADMLGDKELAHCGYKATVALPPYLRGAALLQIRVRDAAGNLLEHSQMLELDPAALSGQIEQPTVEGEANEILSLTGWTVSSLAALAQVEVYLGTVFLGLVHFSQIGQPQMPDFGQNDPLPAQAEASTDNATKAEFKGDFALHNFRAGRYLLKVRIIDRVGNCQDLEQFILVNQPSYRIMLESPSVNTWLGDTLIVRGWAFSKYAPIDKVTVYLGDKLVGEAVHGLPRLDVAEKYQETYAARSGFEAEFKLANIADANEVKVIATTSTGQQFEARTAVRLAKPKEPLAEIELALWKDQLLEVAGWGLWVSSKAPYFVRILVNGQLVGTTTLNLTRPDIKMRFPNYPDAGISGFHFQQSLAWQPLTAQANNELMVEISDDNGLTLVRRLYIEHQGDVEPDDALWQIRELLSSFTEKPNILDWQSKLDLAALLPDYTVVKPLEDKDNLPYLDTTWDVVVIDKTERRHEGQRVAQLAVLGQDGTSWHLHWLEKEGGSKKPAFYGDTPVITTNYAPDLASIEKGSNNG